MGRKLKALIIGGGIGGLTTGIALRRIGIQPIVFERAKAIEAVGAGLSIWSNAVNCLKRLDIADEIIDRGSIVRQARVITTEGKPIAITDVAVISQQAGAPSIMVHRGDLQQSLLHALGAQHVETGAECMGFTLKNDRVLVQLSNGQDVTGDFLIGADGINSAVRRQLFGESPTRYSGVTCWRGVGSFDTPELRNGTSILAIGRGIQMGIIPCRPGQVYWFVALRAAQGGTDSRAGAKQDVRQLLNLSDPLLIDVVDATPESSVFRNDICDRPPIWPWGKQRVTLLGDAVHPMTPNMGQGGCQAMEDAIFLADSLQTGTDIEPSLRHYENRRRQHTAYITQQSRRAGRLLRIRQAAAVGFRNWFMSRPGGQRLSLGILKKMILHEIPHLETVAIDKHECTTQQTA